MAHGEERTHADTRGRATALAFVMVAFCALILMAFLFLVTGPYVFYAAAIVVGLGLFAGLHYVLWGRSMDASVARERAELQAKEEEEQRRAQRPGWERRF
jgi:hypothetical protein